MSRLGYISSYHERKLKRQKCECNILSWPIRIQFRPYPGYEPSFSTPLANVGWLGAENDCVRQTDTLTHADTKSILY